eukprot:2570854-Amphidinium_carterae.1
MEIKELRQGAGHTWASWAKTPLLVRQHLVQLQPLLTRNFLSIRTRLCLMTSAWGCSAPKLLASNIFKARCSCSCAKAKSPCVSLTTAKLWSVTATSGCSGP